MMLDTEVGLVAIVVIANSITVLFWMCGYFSAAAWHKFSKWMKNTDA